MFMKLLLSYKHWMFILINSCHGTCLKWGQELKCHVLFGSTFFFNGILVLLIQPNLRQKCLAFYRSTAKPSFKRASLQYNKSLSIKDSLIFPLMNSADNFNLYIKGNC